MSRIEIVTSFSAAGAELYGRRAVESIRRYWPHPLTVYTDGVVMSGARTTAGIPHWLTTRDRLPSMRPDAEKPTNYIWNAQRFAVKPFVWLDAAERMGDGILVWLDGDTVTHSDVPDTLIDVAMDRVDVAYLGRGSMHPETGFVAFRLPDAFPLMAWCRDAYRFGWFTDIEDGWTDCHVLRRGLKSWAGGTRDLTSSKFDGDWRSGVDAFALSPLGPYVDHLKGSRRKREAA